MIRIRLILAHLLFVIATVSNAQMQDYDFNQNLDFDINSMHLTLEINQDTSLIHGVVTWQITALVDSLNQISFISVRSDIKSVRIDEISNSFDVSGDTLVIKPDVSFVMDQSFKLEIVYDANPDFSLHQTDNGTIWSSFLPAARTELFPSILNPSMQFTTDIRLILPLDWKGVANGVFVTSTLMPEEKRLFHWRSNVPVSITDIGIVAGKMDYQEAFWGSRSIRIYSETGSNSDFDKTQFLDIVMNKINRLESFIDKEFPYQALTFVYLPDHLWEIRSSGATLGFLFGNGNSIDEQLSRVLASQIFGSYHRPKNLSEANHILILQGYLYSLLTDSDVPDYLPWSDYPEVKVDPWIVWSPAVFRNAIYSSLHGTFSANLNKTLLVAITELESAAYDWADYQASHFSLSELSYPQIEISSDTKKELYTINYIIHENSNRYSIEFLPEGNYEHRIFPLKVRQFSSGNINDVDYLVSTAGDVISFTSAGYIENMYAVDVSDSIVITENKPAQFWVYQLRSDSDYEKRIESAVGFSRVKDDPDIQLFLQDLIRSEPDELVKSFLIESYADLTNGALGTHQRFIPLLDNSSGLVKRAALNALMNYPGNEQVQQAVFRVISLSNDIGFVNRAIEIYKEITDEAEFFSVARRLLIEDLQDLQFTATIFPLIVTTDQGREFAPNMMQYLEREYPYFLRILALNTLKEMEISPSYWLEILPELLNDSDPRIRFNGLDLITKFEKNQVAEILEGRISAEYDVRVLHKVQKLLHEM